MQEHYSEIPKRWVNAELEHPDYPEGYPLNGDALYWPDGWKLKDGWGVYPKRTSPRFTEAVEYFLNKIKEKQP